MNDPSLLAIRRAINEDIGNLAALSKIDNDGTILQLNQLANRVDNLRLSGFERDGSPMDKMMKPFQARFLTGSKTSVKAGKALWMIYYYPSSRQYRYSTISSKPRYLSAKISARLLIASQAVPRHQTEIYQQSLEAVSTWVRAYFDTTDPNTTAFLDSINELENGLLLSQCQQN